MQKLFIINKSGCQKILPQLFIVVLIQILAIKIQSSLIQNVVYYFIGGVLYNLFKYLKNSSVIILIISLLTLISGEIEIFRLVFPLIFSIILISIPTKMTLFKHVAKYSFGFYLIHPFIIIFSDKIVFSNVIYGSLIIKLLVVFTISYFISTLLSNNKILKKIV